MDGRNAFVLGQKIPTPFDPEITSPIKPAPGHEEEQLNLTTLAKIPGGLHDVMDSNGSDTRDVSDDVYAVPQKILKHTRPLDKQFKQVYPLIMHPLNFTSYHMGEILSGNNSRYVEHKTEEERIKDEIMMEDRDNIVGAQANEIPKKVEPPDLSANDKSDSETELHARVFEVIKNGKTTEAMKTNASFEGVTSRPGNVMMSIVQHNVTNNGRTLTQREKDAKPIPLKPNGYGRNAVVLLDILTPEEAVKLPYVATDKKKTVAKVNKPPEVVVFRKHQIHRRVHYGK